MRLSSILAALAVLSTSLAARADSIFSTAGLSSSGVPSLTLTNNGASATFTADGYLDVNNSAGLMPPTISLSPFDPSAIDVSFSTSFSSLSFEYAVPNGAGITVDLFENGVDDGSDTFTGTPGPYGGIAGTAFLTGDFNSVAILPATTGLVLGPLDAGTAAVTPEPSSILLLGTGLLGIGGVMRKRFA